MDTRDVLLLAYDAFGGEIHGKTNLQKRLYFLSIMLGIDLGYGPHYYGPYSSEIAGINTGLKVLGYLNESIASAGNYGSEGFEIARHDFTLTEDGRAAVEAKKKRFPEQWDRIKKAAKALNAAGQINYMEMSIAAKAYFLLDQKAGNRGHAEKSERIAENEKCIRPRAFSTREPLRQQMEHHREDQAFGDSEKEAVEREQPELADYSSASGEQSPCQQRASHDAADTVFSGQHRSRNLECEIAEEEKPGQQRRVFIGDMQRGCQPGGGAKAEVGAIHVRQAVGEENSGQQIGPAFSQVGSRRRCSEYQVRIGGVPGGWERQIHQISGGDSWIRPRVSLAILRGRRGGAHLRRVFASSNLP